MDFPFHGSMLAWLSKWRECDLFELWRLLLATVCAIYAIVVTGRSLYGWFVYLSQPDRTTTLIRQVVIVQLLRLRIRSFVGELLQIAFWGLVAFLLLDWHK